MVSADALSLSSTVGTATNVWIRLFCKPTAYDDSAGQPTASDCSAAFYLSTGGVLYAYADTNGASAGGDGWTNVATGVSTTDWLGFSVHLDYDAQLWDLYYTAGSTAAPMTRLNAMPMPMSNQQSNRFWQATISSGGTTYVDAVTIVKGYIELAENTPSPTNVQAVASLTLNRGAAARTIARYFGSSGSGLAQEIGDLLNRALNVNDTISIWFPDMGLNGEWGEYRNDGNGWTRMGLTGPTWDQVRLTRTTGIWIDSSATGQTNAVGVAPYDIVAPSNAVVHGSGTGNGWNYFQWPYGIRQVNDTNKGLGFTPGAGDLLFVYRTADQSYVRLWWKAGTGWMMGGSKSTAEQVEEGIGLWYKRAGAGTTWAISAIE
jgi:hypothetical protein